MSTNISTCRQMRFGSLAAIALAIAGLAVESIPAFAQPTEVVSVVAPRVVRQTIGRSTIGAPIEMATISRSVSYADLDLSKPADAATFETRIKDTATSLCAELDRIYLNETRDPKCVQKASDEAMTRAEQLIAAAKK